MKLGLCLVDLYIPGNHSLKGKRQVLNSVKDRIRSKFNVSIAEVEEKDSWRKTKLGIVTINQNSAEVSNVLQAVVKFIEKTYPTQLIDYQIEIF